MKTPLRFDCLIGIGTQFEDQNS